MINKDGRLQWKLVKLQSAHNLVDYLGQGIRSEKLRAKESTAGVATMSVERYCGERPVSIWDLSQMDADSSEQKEMAKHYIEG